MVKTNREYEKPNLILWIWFGAYKWNLAYWNSIELNYDKFRFSFNSIHMQFSVIQFISDPILFLIINEVTNLGVFSETKLDCFNFVKLYT